MNFDRIIEKIEKNQPIRFGAIFSKSIELFKEVWQQGFIILLLTVVTILPFYIMIYIPMFAAGITDPEILRSENPPLIVVLSMSILFPIVMIGVMTFAMALNAAFLRICYQKDYNRQGGDDYFYFFREGRLGKILTISLIVVGLSIIGMLTCGLGLIYLVVPISLFPAFLTFNQELTAMEMVKAGFKLGNKHWFVIFGLIIVLSIIAELGILLCCIGVLFTAMLSKIPIYFVYKDGVGFNAEDTQY